MAEYLAAVKQQARQMAMHPWSKSIRFTTLYVGGGTPTLYGHEALASLLKTCLVSFGFADDSAQVEVTVEANPNTVTLEKLRGLKQAGVNRLSFGCQSFSDRLLATLGRGHTGADGCAAVRHGRTAGFDNISLDLMYGLPNQTVADWQQTLETAIGLAPEHFSLYELTIEGNTPFGNRLRAGDIVLPDEDTVLEMEAITREMLASSGYERYEISNYARPGFQCEHNTIYWQNGIYLGLGAGAVSYFEGLRIRNVADSRDYSHLVGEGQHPFHDGECLSLEASFRETVIMGLRLTAGIDCHRLEQRFGLTPLAYYGTTLEGLIEEKLIELHQGHLRLTDQGRPLANQVLAQLV
jgi:oxygen-independent coproporphyrinogen-3 oxidase